MHVELDDGDARQAVRVQRVHRPDGHCAKEAKAHRAGAFGVMPGRAAGNKGVARAA